MLAKRKVRNPKNSTPKKPQPPVESNKKWDSDLAGWRKVYPGYFTDPFGKQFPDTRAPA